MTTGPSTKRTRGLPGCGRDQRRMPAAAVMAAAAADCDHAVPGDGAGEWLSRSHFLPFFYRYGDVRVSGFDAGFHASRTIHLENRCRQPDRLVPQIRRLKHR